MLNYSETVCSAKPVGVVALASKADFCLPYRAVEVQKACTGFCTSVLFINAEL